MPHFGQLAAVGTGYSLYCTNGAVGVISYVIGRVALQINILGCNLSFFGKSSDSLFTCNKPALSVRKGYGMNIADVYIGKLRGKR